MIHAAKCPEAQVGLSYFLHSELGGATSVIKSVQSVSF
jgi:hypothetical protein